jgi:hypothetical protein
MNAASVQESNPTSQFSTFDPSSKDEALEPSKTYEIIRGRTHTLEDFIDTDAVRYRAKALKPLLIIHSWLQQTHFSLARQMKSLANIASNIPIPSSARASRMGAILLWPETLLAAVVRGKTLSALSSVLE